MATWVGQHATAIEFAPGVGITIENICVVESLSQWRHRFRVLAMKKLQEGIGLGLGSHLPVVDQASKDVDFAVHSSRAVQPPPLGRLPIDIGFAPRSRRGPRPPEFAHIHVIQSGAFGSIAMG